MKTYAVLLLLLAGCQSHQDYDYIPLREYHCRKGQLSAGAEVQLLAFSGTGRKAQSDEALYYQFIVRRGDSTFRILAPGIEFRMDNEYTYTDPSALKKEETPTTAIYQPIDSTTRLMMQAAQLEEMAEKQQADDGTLDRLRGKVNLVQRVIVPVDSKEWFGKEEMPTVMGVLQFAKKPW